MEHSVFTAQRRLTIRLSELAPSRADDYRAFRNSVLADSAQLLIIESATANTKAVPSAMTAEELMKSGDEARNNGNYKLAIDLLNRAVDVDPKSKRGWDKLGLAYYDSRQDELALNAFRKQVEINPYVCGMAQIRTGHPGARARRLHPAQQCRSGGPARRRLSESRSG